MDITIVKIESGPHRAVVARPGAEAVQFALYDYGPVLPHDLVHYVVEDELGLQFGFGGLLAAGAKLQSVQAYGARDPRRIPPSDDPPAAAHIDDLLAAEGFVAAFSVFPGTAPEPELDAGRIERIRARINALKTNSGRQPDRGTCCGCAGRERAAEARQTPRRRPHRGGH